MARKTVSLLPSILRLLIAAAIAGVLSLCSLAIERTKGLFKLSDGACIQIIGAPAPILLPPRSVRSNSISRELHWRADQRTHSRPRGCASATRSTSRRSCSARRNRANRSSGNMSSRLTLIRASVPSWPAGHYAAAISKRGLLLVTPKDLAGCGPSAHELNAWANQARGRAAFRDSAGILGRRACRGQPRGDTRTRPERSRSEHEHLSG